MIGLEYILEVYKIQQKDLAEELGIKKQNITMWIKGKQKISKKYLPILSEKFDIPIEYLQKELTELDKKFIEKKQLSEYIDKTAVEEKDFVWDEEIQDYIMMKRKYYDVGAVENYRILQAEEKEIKTLNKIKSFINDVGEFEEFETYIERYEKNINLFDRYADIVNSSVLEKGIIFDVIRALEFCILELKEKEEDVTGRKQKRTIEDEKSVVQEIYKVIMDSVIRKNTEREKFRKEMKELGLLEDTDDLC